MALFSTVYFSQTCCAVAQCSLYHRLRCNSSVCTEFIQKFPEDVFSKYMLSNPGKMNRLKHYSSVTGFILPVLSLTPSSLIRHSFISFPAVFFFSVSSYFDEELYIFL